MKKITIKTVNEDIYYEKLDNGMDVYMYINSNVHNNSVTFTTKYGSVYNEWKDNDGKIIKVPNGIAHFLEHKVFAVKDGLQPEEYYGQYGCNSNAYTTFKNTTYLFNGSENLYNNVGYLLDFVQSIYLTKESVEAEKGIITQEINMCNDRPGDILYDKIRENTIKVNPFKNSIIGTVKDIKGITKELLEKCYYKFYHPSNMFLVVTGNFDKDKMLEVIKENQKKKTFVKNASFSVLKYDEPDKVVREREVVKCNTNIPKVAYSIKVPINKFKMDDRKLRMALFLILNLLFGDTSEFDSDCKNEGIISNTLYYNILDIDTHFVISLINSTDKYEELIKRIDERLTKIDFDLRDFNRKKKVFISNEIFSYENIEMVNDMIVDNVVFDNTVYDDMIGLIKSLTIEDINNIVNKIDVKNKSIVILKK